MKLQLVVGVLILLKIGSVLAESPEEHLDNDQEDEDYEDIVAAESQDIAHSHLYLNSESQDTVNRSRSRPRGRKRRRRLRKRPRSTTPSFIEEYEPEKTIKEEELPTPEAEVIYQRRRPSKRRRRPIRRKPEYEAETPDPEILPEPHDDRPLQEYHRPRNSQRRRRKGSRKRIRLTTESTSESINNQEESLQEITTQLPEIVMQTNSHTPSHESVSDMTPSHNQEETTPVVFTSGFTTKEITEINHKLESLSEYPDPSENNYQISGLGAFSINQFSSADSTTQNLEENHVISLSTTQAYPWINRFDPQSEINSKITEQSTTQSYLDTEKTKVQIENIIDPHKGNLLHPRNIEKIIENRKNLFSTSKRLPPTSAVIRRRLRPRKNRNSTTIKATLTDNTIPSVNPTDINGEQTLCQNGECAINITSLLSNNIIPSALLPSGFPTMPEILSAAELIQKISNKPYNEELTTQSITTREEILNHRINIEVPKHDNLIIITPSTLIRSNNDENKIHGDEYGNLPDVRVINEETNKISEVQNKIQLLPSTSEIKIKPTEIVPLPTTEITFQDSTVTTPTIQTTTYVSEDNKKTTQISSEEREETEPNFSIELTTKNDLDSDKLTLEGVDISSINDEILELIMDDMGKARVKRILELRNMTLSELIAHRERGAGHFTSFNSKNNTKNNTTQNKYSDTLNTEVEKTDELTGTKKETSEEEQTEKLIIEKAKHLLSEYNIKKIDYSSHSTVIPSPQGENVNFAKKLKVEGTVIPVPILESTHTSTIQFPEDGVLGAFPKYMYDIAGKRSKPNEAIPNEKSSLYKESTYNSQNIQTYTEKREPRVFESMPKFSSDSPHMNQPEIPIKSDWRLTVDEPSTEKTASFPGISEEIILVATHTTKPMDQEDVILLDEGEEAHHLRNHILGGNINVESRDISDDDDYTEPKKVPAAVKSAIAASGALLGLAIFGFLAVLVSCKIRQRRARLRATQDILCEHLAEDIRSSQRSLTPVLRKSPFNHNIHSNTASNRHYYLWRTLRKTFQYE